MKIARQSFFKNPEKDKAAFESWKKKVVEKNGYSYDELWVETSLGKTKVYGLNIADTTREMLVIFPGFRTTTLIWDFNQGLSLIAKTYRIFMVETNGQPNLSDGNTPDIKGLGYGEWGKEIFDALEIKQAYITGASFGGLVCMKIALVIPDRIKAAILLNPGCFRYVSFGAKNMFYNLLPLIRLNRKNMQRFLNQVVFNQCEDRISSDWEALLAEYLMLAISAYKDNTQKPYPMGEQLRGVTVPTHLVLGENDILLPYKKSLQRAEELLGNNLKSVHIENYGHGIELYPKAIRRIADIIKKEA